MNDQDAQRHIDVEVHVKSLKTNDKTQFEIAKITTLRQVWDVAIDENHLDEQRTPGDVFRCHDGTDLTAHLHSTLEQLAAEGVCRDHDFEIRGPSGGA